jgi:hypothetical protein
MDDTTLIVSTLTLLYGLMLVATMPRVCNVQKGWSQNLTALLIFTDSNFDLQSETSETSEIRTDSKEMPWRGIQRVAHGYSRQESVSV